MNTTFDNTQSLTETLITELTKAFAFSQNSHAKQWIRFFFGKAAGNAARLGVGLDKAVAEGGIYGGARWLLPRFVKSHEARGQELIPTSGPLVIAANHPASIDSIVISAHINRPDYKVIIGDIPFFERLPNISKHAIYVPNTNNIQGRMHVIRESIRHLNSGGALLIFPRGGIEPDPEIMAHPDGEFNRWSRSLQIFLERIPNLEILVTMVSGVISRSAIRHPITVFRKHRPDKQRLAFLYQLARQIIAGREIFGLTPRVTFGEIVRGRTHNHMLEEIERAAHRTLTSHMDWAYT